MKSKAFVVGLVGCLALAGCVEPGGFGGSGGSGGGFGGSGGTGSASLSLGRDMCTRAVREDGRVLVSVDSVREYGGNTPRGVEVRMTTRRSAMTVSTEPRVCRFSYATGTADVSRT